MVDGALTIERLWGTREFTIYMKTLLRDAQDGAKTGFPQSVMSALLNISASHDKEFSELLPGIEGSVEFKSLHNSFPRISEKISALWGTAEFNPYLSGLLHDNRGDNRRGFPFETLTTLHALAERHNKEFAHLYAHIDLWTFG